MRALSLTILLFAGCRPDPEPIPLVTVVDASVPERAALAPVVGYGPVEVPVRLLNRYGAAVEGGSLELSVSGPTASIASGTVVIDPTGYGELEVETSAPGAFEVTIDSASDPVAVGDAVQCWSVAGVLPAWGLRPSWLPPAELSGVRFAASLLDGVVLATEMDLWYLATGEGADARPYRVLTMPDPVLEMETVHVDNDGVPDLLVRSVDELVLLRGRAAGGLSWGAGFAAEGLELMGASLDDVDGDTRNDVGFALQSSEGAWLVIMGGDGAWGFEEQTELRFELDYAVVDVELSQSDGDGQAEVALLKSDSTLMRYYWSAEAEAWAETYPSSLETHLAEPASFLGAADLNDGGAEEPILLSHAQDGVEQSAVFYTLDGNTTQYQKSYLAPQWGLDDLSGDGITDVLALEGGDLHMIHFEADDGGADFAYHTVGGVYLRNGTEDDEHPVAGPIAAGLLDGDRLPDLAMASDAIHLFPGKESESAWAPRDGRRTAYDLVMLHEPVLGDLDEAPGLDTMAAWVTSYAAPTLRTWWIEPNPHGDAPTLSRRGELVFDDAATALDVTIADGQVYGLIDQDGTVLVAMARTQSDTYDELDRVAVDGAVLVPGSFSQGGVLAVVSAEGSVSYRDPSLAEVGTDELGSYACVAAADTDGDGVDELVTAADAGCDLLAVDLDGDGTDELARMGSDGLSLILGGEEHALEGLGHLAAGDLDGDGAPELLATSGGRIWIHRAVGGDFVPGVGLHGSGAFLGTPTLGDVTGDGLDDIVTMGEAGELEVLWGE